MKARVLYLGRNDHIYQALGRHFEPSGGQVQQVTTQKSTLEVLERGQVDLVIIDAANPRLSINRFGQTVQRSSPDTVILWLLEPETALGDAPGDFILVRPFTARKLAQQVDEALATRQQFAVERGPFQLNTRTRTLVMEGRTIPLSPKLTQLLAELLRHANQLLSRKQLMARVWDTDYLADTRTLEVHVRWLRQKIEPEPEQPIYVITVRGKGYCLRVEDKC